MKIRLDFVTNSSSSSYYLDRELAIAFVNSSNIYYFDSSEEHCPAMGKRKKENAPTVFFEYVKWHLLMKGTKPTIGKVMSGKGINSFAEYLKQNKKESGDYYVVVKQKKYQIGYGESEQLSDFTDDYDYEEYNSVIIDTTEFSDDLDDEGNHILDYEDQLIKFKVRDDEGYTGDAYSCMEDENGNEYIINVYDPFNVLSSEGESN